jgi:hypothetical protein
MRGHTNSATSRLIANLVRRPGERKPIRVRQQTLERSALEIAAKHPPLSYFCANGRQSPRAAGSFACSRLAPLDLGSGPAQTAPALYCSRDHCRTRSALGKRAGVDRIAGCPWRKSIVTPPTYNRTNRPLRRATRHYKCTRSGDRRSGQGRDNEGLHAPALAVGVGVGPPGVLVGPLVPARCNSEAIFGDSIRYRGFDSSSATPEDTTEPAGMSELPQLDHPLDCFQSMLM